jgi:hypothetical protein
MRLERKIDKSGSSDVNFGDLVVGAQFDGNGFGKFARLLPGILGEHHCGIGRHVTVRRIARRLDNDARKIHTGTEHSAGRGANALKHIGKQILGLGRARHYALRLT